MLLIESRRGLVLIDSGLGTDSLREPARRIGPIRHFVRPTFDPGATALSQISAAGFDPKDVRHIVLTHLDADHTGGVADFPWAMVHALGWERDGFSHPHTARERLRYASARAGMPEARLEVHDARAGERWYGFEGARVLTEVDEDIMLVPMPGHTRGHLAVAVKTDRGWLLHAGDAFYDHRQLSGLRAPRPLLVLERSVAHDIRALRANQRRLAEIWQDPAHAVKIVNAHDPLLLTGARGGTTPR